MKILFIQPYISFLGVISDVLPGYLAKRGHHVEVIGYVREKEKLRIILDKENIHFHFIDAFSISTPNFVTEFPYFLYLEDTIRQIQPEIIHINNLPFLTTLQSTQIAKKMGIPSIIHVHGVISKSNSLLNFAQYSFIRTIGRSIFYDATLLICLTESDAKEIQNCGCPSEKIRIIPNGVDVEKFKPCDEVIENVVFWGGRFIQTKGLEYLIKALYLVVKKEPVKLIMAGDGPLFLKIYNMVKHFGLERNVVFKSRVPHSEIPRLIGVASICALPSVKEGMPYVLLEAMSCGKSVIGSDISGINDVITHGKNGILVPPENPEALANAIILLLENKSLRTKLGQNARQLMVEKYSWDVITKKIEKAYYETIKETK